MIRRQFARYATCLTVCMGLFGGSVFAAEPAVPEKTKIIRFEEDPAKGAKLSTAIITLKNDKGQTVHLVGAIHIADKAYYARLMEIFSKYDALCFELIMPEDMKVPDKNRDRGGQMNTVSVLQRFMKDNLGLQYQLDGIDYSAKNFVHADLSAEEFELLQAQNNESLITLLLRQIIHQMSDPNAAAASANVSLTDLLLAMTSPDRADQLKLIFGRSFGQIEEDVGVLQGTVLLTKRNEKAVAVAKKVLGEGKKEIGIFYGAAHLPGMMELLTADGFKVTDTQWLTAWDIPKKAAPQTRPMR